MKSKAYNIRISNGKDSKSQTISFEGDLSIKNISSIKRSIQAIKVIRDSVVIHLKGVEKLDITSIQLIKAFRASLINNGKSIQTISELTPDIESLLMNTGFDNTL